MLHTSAGAMGLRAPTFDKHIAEEAKTEAIVLRNLRLASDEKGIKDDNNKDKKGKKGKKGNADEELDEE